MNDTERFYRQAWDALYAGIVRSELTPKQQHSIVEAVATNARAAADRMLAALQTHPEWNVDEAPQTPTPIVRAPVDSAAAATAESAREAAEIVRSGVPTGRGGMIDATGEKREQEGGGHEHQA